MKWRLKFRSILYCLGRSNKSYFDPTIRHPAIFNDHFSWLVFLTYWVHFWVMTYWLTVVYFFRYQFIGWAKDTAIEATFLWLSPINILIEELMVFWTLYAFLDPIFYRNVNLLKWHSDWYVVSWAQYYFFYRYFRPVRYFFYLKIYWVDFWWFLREFIDALGEAREDYEGHYTIKAQKKYDKIMQEKARCKRLGIPYVRNTDHKRSKVIFNKEIFYPDKLRYYTDYRTKTKLVKTDYFKDSNWWG